MADLEQGVLIAYLSGGVGERTSDVCFKFARLRSQTDFLDLSKPRKLNLSQDTTSSLLNPVINLWDTNPSNEILIWQLGISPLSPEPIVPGRTTLTLTGIGGLLWQDGLSQLQLLLTGDSNEGMLLQDPPSRAFVLELGPNLDVSSVARLPVYQPIGTSLVDTIRNSRRPGASLFSINGRTFATASPFYRPVEDLIVMDTDPSLVDRRRNLIRVDRSTGILCCRKQPGDRDFASPTTYGKHYYPDYQPSSDWYTTGFILPANHEGAMPSSITYLPNSSRVFALFPTNDDRTMRLGVTSANALGSVTPTSADLRWSYITLSIKDGDLKNVTALAVQPPFPDCKPVLYLFGVNHDAQLWYSRVQLQGYEGLYGDLDLEPGISELSLDHDQSWNTLGYHDGPNKFGPVIVDSRIQLRAVQLDSVIQIYVNDGSGDGIVAYQVRMLPDGWFYDKKVNPLGSVFGDYMKVGVEKAQLLGVCVVPAKYFQRW